ncbi:MAG TPA: PQQ-binding-like beta-propeller repeat protein [Pyrinomonadaceae bacterium]|nr:PQQ-binding-like beta-propeller repeat protein [Pyrinomonadaceae bacterium]
MSRFAPLNAKLLLPLTLLFLLALACPLSLAAQDTTPQAKQVGPSILIRWQGTPGIARYRLQLATDEAFKDIVFDRAVVGRQYVVKELPPGNYFWRVAPAAGETGSYSTPTRVTLGDAPSGVVAVADVVMPADTGGWRTATGDVLRPVPAALRSGGVVDLVAVNAEGTIYAVDGVSGIALWTARYRPEARRGDAAGESPKPFAPLVLRQSQGESNIVVGFDGGVRALRGGSGRELWRAKLEGRVTGGVAADLNGDGSEEVALVTANPERLYVLDGASGRVTAEQKLEAEAIGAPFPLGGATKGLALALTNERIEIRGADGALTLETKTAHELTTAPLVVSRGPMSVLVVGTDKGLTALSLPELRTLGNIVADDDSVRGTLSAADMDGDGTTEIIMVTKRGRVALVSTIDGNVRWYAEGATDAGAAAFADLNADGILDVIVPGGAAFAVGFSGRDGSLIWKVEEGGRSPAAAGGAEGVRALVVAPSLNGGAVLVGSDPSRTGLRAVELPKGALKAASR